MKPIDWNSTNSGPPRSDRATATCPRCGVLAQFNGPAQGYKRSKVDAETAVCVLECNACRKGTVVIEKGVWDSTQRELSFKREGAVTWWPPIGGSHLINDEIELPADVRAAYDEGMRCLSVEAWHGAAACLRTVLAQIAQDKGSEKVRNKRTLADKLTHLASENVLVSQLADYTTAVRALGNAIHQEDWEPLTSKQAHHLGELARLLIHVLYEIPYTTQKMMPARRT